MSIRIDGTESDIVRYFKILAWMPISIASTLILIVVTMSFQPVWDFIDNLLEAVDL